MRKKIYYLYLDAEEIRLLLNSLINFKSALTRQGRYTDIVDEIILKVAAL